MTAMQNLKRAELKEVRVSGCSRRHALALMLAGAGLGSAAPDNPSPMRLAISDKLIADVNLNDARAAMLIWIKRICQDLNVVIDNDPRVFDTTKEILNRLRAGTLDTVAINAVEYWQMADLLDGRQIVAQADPWAQVQYVILAKRNSGIVKLSDLRGRRLAMLTAPRMCVADAWLTTILHEENLGPAGQFFGSVSTDTKAFQVVLPVFFGKVDACLTMKQAFETICELNPQVKKDMVVIASSPSMVVNLYTFRNGFQSVYREKLIKALSNLSSSAAGRQLALLFQFEQLAARDSSCLASSQHLLEKADRIRRQGIGSKKG